MSIIDNESPWRPATPHHVPPTQPGVGTGSPPWQTQPYIGDPPQGPLTPGRGDWFVPYQPFVPGQYKYTSSPAEDDLIRRLQAGGVKIPQWVVKDIKGGKQYTIELPGVELNTMHVKLRNNNRLSVVYRRFDDDSATDNPESIVDFDASLNPDSAVCAFRAAVLTVTFFNRHEPESERTLEIHAAP